jgi:pimeloyl-ACP methyl ester carboxylesterase
MRVIYLPGIAGFPGVSPALAALDVDVVVPDLVGFDGAPGFESPAHYLGWITALWDAVDATGALPCPVIGASLGGMLAADLAALRPEAVTRVALLAPLGIFDPEHPTTDLFTMAAPARLEALFAGDVPEAFSEIFAERGPEEQLMAQHIVSVATASLLWPLADQHLRTRVHRITMPSLLVWGEDDAIIPVEVATQWPLNETVVVRGAGHMVEWDAPDAVAHALRGFLALDA